MRTVTCRRVEVVAGVWSNQLRFALCGILRGRDGVVAIPSNLRDKELFLLGNKPSALQPIQRDDYQAEFRDVGGIDLDLRQETGRKPIAQILELSVTRAFEQSPKHWRLSSSLRQWYVENPLASVEGVDVLSRIAFSTLVLGDNVGITFDPGYLYRTHQTLDYFFDAKASPEDLAGRQREFNRLSSRKEGRKGTLLYDLGGTLLSVCYFEREGKGVTCGTTGPIQGSASLFEYYQKRNPRLSIRSDDAVLYVSFPGLKVPYPVPVAAKLLRLRIMPDKEKSFFGLGRFKNIAPADRRTAAVKAWESCREIVEKNTGLRLEETMWAPEESACELLEGPELQFGKDRKIVSPAAPDVQEYQRYYRDRLTNLRRGGLYRYEEAVERKLQMITPTAWDANLNQAFVQDFQKSMEGITGLGFKITANREDDPDRMIEKLGEVSPGTAVVVFDNRATDRATYFLLSHGLAKWNLKRLTKQVVEQKWNAIQQASNAGERRKAENRWRDMIELSVLDTLDQMEATPWRVRAFPYHACLAIDVGEGRRYFGMSLLVCRGENFFPSFSRITQVWPKGDHQHEAINPEILADKIVQLFSHFSHTDFSPLDSMLVLRDGHQCGHEPKGINKGIEGLRNKGRLTAAAEIDVVDVHKQTMKHLRMWYRDSGTVTNVLEGQAIYLDDSSALVSCTGLATLSSAVTAEPCLLAAKNGAKIRKPVQAFFALAQLNYSNPTKAHRFAGPLRESDVRLQQRIAQDMRGIK